MNFLNHLIPNGLEVERNSGDVCIEITQQKLNKGSEVGHKFCISVCILKIAHRNCCDCSRESRSFQLRNRDLNEGVDERIKLFKQRARGLVLRVAARLPMKQLDQRASLEELVREHAALHRGDVHFVCTNKMSSLGAPTKIAGITFKYATFAEKHQGALGRDYYIARGAYGKGLFARKALLVGTVICPYDGKLLSEPEAKGKVKTHMIKPRGSHFIVDGLPLANSLRWDKTDKKYWPQDLELWDMGWACIANSSAGGVSNAKMLTLRDDRDVRAAEYDEETQARLPTRVLEILSTRAYLVASRDIEKDEEILWYYNPVFDSSDEVVDLTEA